MPRGSRLRRAWAVGAAAITVVGLAYTAVQPPSLERFNNELSFRGEQGRSLHRLLETSAVERGLRCGAVSVPTHKLIPDTRWVLDLGESRRGRALRPVGGLAAQGALRGRDLPGRAHEHPAHRLRGQHGRDHAGARAAASSASRPTSTSPHTCAARPGVRERLRRRGAVPVRARAGGRPGAARSGCASGGSSTGCRSSTTSTRPRTSSRRRSATTSPTATTRTTSSTRRRSRTCCTWCSGSGSAAAGRSAPRTRSAAPSRPIRRAVFVVSRATSAVLGTAAVGVRLPDRRAALRPPRGARRRGRDGGRVPARLLLAPGAERRARAAAAGRVGVRQRGRADARARRSTTRSRAPGWAWPRRRSTRPGSCVLPLLVACGVAAARPDRARSAARRGARRRGARGRRFVLANPHALLSFDEFWSDVRKQEEAASGLRQARPRLRLGAPLLPVGADLGARLGAARGGRSRARCVAFREDVRSALFLVPWPLVFIVYMGTQERFFGRWLLPAFPALALLAGLAVVRAVDALAARPRARAGGGRGARSRRCSPRASSTACTSTACSRATTRATSRAPGWSANVPAGLEGGGRADRARTPGSPTPTCHDAADGPRAAGSPARGGAGSSSRPAARRSTSRAARSRAARGASSASRTTSARCARRWSAPTRAAATAGWCRLDAVRARARATRARSRTRSRYYRDARAPRRRRLRGVDSLPRRARARSSSTSTGASTTTRAPTSGPGPTVVIHRLRGGRCAGDGRRSGRSLRFRRMVAGAASRGRRVESRATEHGLTERDTRHMQRAIELAELGRGHTSPNPLVGAVVARDDQVLGEGYHAAYGGDARRGGGARRRARSTRSGRRCT